MEDTSWKDRIKAEYEELHERYLKLKKFNTKEEASSFGGFSQFSTDGNLTCAPMKDAYARSLRERQQSTMGEYLHILELRAALHGIEL